MSAGVLCPPSGRRNTPGVGALKEAEPIEMEGFIGLVGGLPVARYADQASGIRPLARDR
mgnify:CR=1 FL=1